MLVYVPRVRQMPVNGLFTYCHAGHLDRPVSSRYCDNSIRLVIHGAIVAEIRVPGVIFEHIPLGAGCFSTTKDVS